LDYATALGLRSGENPARWSVLETVLPKKIKRTKHHVALSYERVPAFVASLAKYRGEALEFLILTGARSCEVIGAVWSEFELRAIQVMKRDDEGTEKPVMGPFWIIPAERMKENRQHRVPLSARVVEILEEKWKQREGDFVFTGPRKGRPMGKNTFLNLRDEMSVDDKTLAGITIHGLRSSFRDWAGEETKFTTDICEVAISHIVGGPTQTAYQHGTLFEKRRELMNEWDAYCRGLPPLNEGVMVPNAEVIHPAFGKRGM
jgi:integrase